MLIESLHRHIEIGLLDEKAQSVELALLDLHALWLDGDRLAAKVKVALVVPLERIPLSNLVCQLDIAGRATFRLPEPAWRRM